jgi:hypothetical protein
VDQQPRTEFRWEASAALPSSGTQDLPIHSDYFGLVDNNTHKPSFSAYQQCATY